MKKILTTLFTCILFLVQTICSYGQEKKDEQKIKSLSKFDIGFQGIGFSFDRRLSDKATIDLAAGMGGGYSISENSFTYHWNFLQPAFYFSLTPKFYYNRKNRMEQEKNNQMNAGNYIGIRLKFTTPGIRVEDNLSYAMLLNVHWGLQRALRKNWIFNTHIGVGSMYDITNRAGRLYPAFDIRFSHVL
jgi:hypothetical protein